MAKVLSLRVDDKLFKNDQLLSQNIKSRFNFVMIRFDSKIFNNVDCWETSLNFADSEVIEIDLKVDLI